MKYFSPILVGLMLALMIGAVSTVACNVPADSIKTLDNPNTRVAVELITSFEHVRLYRVRLNDGIGFKDVFVAVQDGRVEVTWNEHQGKTVVTRESTTLAVK